MHEILAPFFHFAAYNIKNKFGIPICFILGARFKDDSLSMFFQFKQI